MSLSSPSYAKVNLFLHVLGKRPDGYHNIYTLFCCISLHDTITITPNDSTLLCNTGISIPLTNNNIILKIDKILRQEYGLNKHFKIAVTKRIPVGAGLGGGSGNACTYLQLVNEAEQLNLSTETMHNILAKVGSDTPFFLYPPLAIGSGRGEIIKSLKSSVDLSFILINPGIFISTPSVYNDANLELTSESDLPRIATEITAKQIVSIMKNDMQKPVIIKYPLISQICIEIENAGAMKAMMSGSGSTVFGVFENDSIRDEAYDTLKKKYANYKVFKANNVK